MRPSDQQIRSEGCATRLETLKLDSAPGEAFFVSLARMWREKRGGQAGPGGAVAAGRLEIGTPPGRLSWNTFLALPKLFPELGPSGLITAALAPTASSKSEHQHSR